MHKLSSYAAPSWSWASIEGENGIDFTGCEGSTQDGYCVHIEDLHITLASSDPTGRILSVNLRLSCQYTIHGSLQRTKKNCYEAIFTSSQRSIKIYARFDCIPMPDGLLKDVDFVLIRHHKKFPHAAGLMLQNTGQKPGQYSRVGYFSFFKEKHLINFHETAWYRGCHVEDFECVEFATDNESAKRSVIEIISLWVFLALELQVGEVEKMG
jgi:hypothetical protein